ncbi:amidase [Nitratireductor indicus]|uniref:amidase n=1 Tax=Nitratireductor indicus TaxID=721133 RepID=UPI002876333F|nr:amidase [Nitratireductor indicus]MDS1135159.1 amidase [Nitratireductor indicus]
MAMTDLADRAIHELAPLLREGAVSPVEVLEACLHRIEATDPLLHAFVHLCRETARADARACERELASGLYKGPLHGIPFAVKDLLDVAGLSTTAGSKHLSANIAHQTATSIRRLTEAGAIFLGKLHMVEFAFGGWGTNHHMGPPRNPWDLVKHRSPGGSSSGSGVAVAAGMVPFALGSDTGGSIRSPASMNGIVGLKPTTSSVSTHGVFPLSQTLDSIGPMTRSVEDAAILFDALSGYDPLDPGTFESTPPRTCQSLRQPVRGMKLGVVGERQLPKVEPEILDAFRKATTVFRDLGTELIEMTLPRAPLDYCPEASNIIRTEGYANLAEIVEEGADLIDPFVKERVLAGNTGSAADFALALARRRSDMQEMRAAMAGVDALLLPTTPIAAPALSSIDEYAMPLSDLTRFVNYLGMCALAVPCGFNDRGMPLSLQIVAASQHEDAILRLGFAFEEATPWHTRHPDLSSLLA